MWNCFANYFDVLQIRTDNNFNLMFLTWLVNSWVGLSQLKFVHRSGDSNSAILRRRDIQPRASRSFTWISSLGAFTMTKDNRLILYFSNRSSTTQDTSLPLHLPTDYSPIITCSTLRRLLVTIMRRKGRNAWCSEQNIVANCKFTSSLVDLCCLDYYNFAPSWHPVFIFIHYLCLYSSSYIPLSSPATSSLGYDRL